MERIKLVAEEVPKPEIKNRRTDYWTPERRAEQGRKFKQSLENKKRKEAEKQSG